MNELENIYNTLKNTYNLILTTTEKLNDGFTIDVPVIAGECQFGKFRLYKEDEREVFYVFSVEYFNNEKQKYSHNHPHGMEEAIKSIIRFVSEGKL